MSIMGCGNRIKRVTRDRFIEDTTAILDARRIFIDSNVTRNITIAYELYQAVLAEKEAVSEQWPVNRKPQPCPECGSINVVRIHPCGKFEGHEFCKDCDYETFF